MAIDERAVGGRSLFLKDGEINFAALHLFERDAGGLVPRNVHIYAGARAPLNLLAALCGHEYEAILRVNFLTLALLRILFFDRYRVGGFCHISPQPA